MSVEQRRGNRLLIIIIFILLIIILLLLWLLFGQDMLGGRVGGLPGILGTPFPPPPPSNIQADHVAVFDVFVEWQDNSNNEDGFYIYRETIGEEEDPVRVGTAGEDAVEFLDTDTSCGEIYHYTIASYNAAGESPATPCWDIVMPLCPVGRDVTFGVGTNYGYNFLSGGQSAINDLYLRISDAGQLMFMADLAWQLGLFDVGAAPEDTPLDQTDMPADPAYVQDGIPAMVVHRYVAQATDGVHLILFDLTGLGESAEATYILWTPRSIIDVSPCEVAVGGYTPGGGCFAGDGICDRTCPTGDVDCGRVPPDPLIEHCQSACGDGVCQDDECSEECATCPMDCPCSTRMECICGDGVCDLPCDETCDSCPEDCLCWPGPCTDVACGDGICTVECGEDCATCLADCWMTCPPDLCGDGHCNVGGGENACTCPDDCSTECGDGFCYCMGDCCPEDCFSCEIDCGACADLGCPVDHCGDGECNCGETTSDCPVDCPGGTTGLGDCGAACESSDDCIEGLACFDRICWEDCLCEGRCGPEEPGESGEPGCQQTCQTDTECGCPNGSCQNGCCVCP